MGGTDPGWDRKPPRRARGGHKALTQKQIHRSNADMRRLEEQQQASSSHAQEHEKYIEAYPKRTPETPCFSSYRGKDCLCERQICNLQRITPLVQVEVPENDRPAEMSSVTDFEVLYALSLTASDLHDSFRVAPALMDRIYQMVRGPANDRRYKAIHCIEYLRSLRVPIQQCCSNAQCFGKCYIEPRLNEIDPETVFRILYVGRPLLHLTPDEIKVVSKMAHRCKLYCKEFYNEIPEGPVVKFDRCELELHTQLSVLRNSIETLRHYGVGVTCCQKECAPKMCTAVHDRLQEIEMRVDPLIMYVHSNDYKTISTGPRRQEIWAEFNRLKALRNAKYSIINSDQFLGLDLDEELVLSDFITKIAKSFGVSCCRNKCGGHCSLVEDTRKKLFKDESTLLTDDVLQDRVVEFDVPVHSSPAFWMAIILFPFVLLATWWHSLVGFDMILYVAVSCSALSVCLPFWFTVRHHSNLTEVEINEVEQSMTEGNRPYCNPLGTRKEKEEFIAPSLTRVQIVSRSYFSYLMCFDPHKICEIPHFINFIETHPFLLFSVVTTILLPWWDFGVQFAAWYLLLAGMASAYSVDNMRVKLICRQAFAAIISKDSLMHGKSLLDFQVSVATLTRQLDNLLHPMVTHFYTKNHENIMNLTIDVATLAYHARKQSETWLSYLKVEAPRNSGMMSLVWSDMVMGFFQPLLLCLARGLVFLLVVVAPVISLHGLIQTVLPAIIMSLFFPLVVFFSLVPLIHTLISEALTGPSLERYTGFVDALLNQIALRCVDSDDSLLAGLVRISIKLIDRFLTLISGWSVPITQWLRRPNSLTCCNGYRLVPSGDQVSTDSSVWLRAVQFWERGGSVMSPESIALMNNQSLDVSSEDELIPVVSHSSLSSRSFFPGPDISRDSIDPYDLTDLDHETFRSIPSLRPSNIQPSSSLEL